MPETQQIMKETGSTAEHRVEEELQTHDTQDLSDLSLPFTVEGVTLISPGTWNSKKYPEQEIRQAVNRSDFTDPDVRSLFNEHDDEDSRDWVGEVRNPRMEGEELVGDLDIVTAEEARKLAYGARFGISAKVTGRDARDTMRDFRYDNFSLVLDPAVKTTFINSDNSKNDSDEDTANLKNVTVKSTMSEQNSQDLSEEELQKIEELAETVENADVEDLANIMSPFMGMQPSELREHIADMVENAEHEEEMSSDVDAIDVEEVADKVADKVSAEMADEEDEEEDEADEAEESLSVDEIADKVAAQLGEDEEETEEDAEESDEELSVDEVVSEVKSEIKEELESVKEELSAEDEDDEEDEEDDAEASKTPNPGSQATGQSQELEDKVEDLDAEDLDKGMARHMLRAQSSSLK